jgi:hypothetical protein
MNFFIAKATKPSDITLNDQMIISHPTLFHQENSGEGGQERGDEFSVSI